MEKMPVKYYEYYSLLEPFVLNYYQLDAPEKARQVFEEVAAVYQDYLRYYSGLRLERQYNIADEIISNMERYRSMIDMVIIFDEEDYARAKATEFNGYLQLFRHFYGEDDTVETPDSIFPEQQPQQEIPELQDSTD